MGLHLPEQAVTHELVGHVLGQALQAGGLEGQARQSVEHLHQHGGLGAAGWVLMGGRALIIHYYRLCRYRN